MRLAGRLIMAARPSSGAILKALILSALTMRLRMFNELVDALLAVSRRQLSAVREAIAG